MRNYGTRAFDIATPDTKDMGPRYGADLFQREVDYLIDHEWARSAQDILWRRSKLGLFVSQNDADRLQTYIDQRNDTASPAMQNVA